VLERLRSQAALQDAVRGDPEARRHVLLDAGPGRGLARLPAPDQHDLFFDMEGDPLLPGGGLEYLFGVEGPGGFRAFWALDPAQEKLAFEAFMDHALRPRAVRGLGTYRTRRPHTAPGGSFPLPGGAGPAAPTAWCRRPG
jgi:uncharacterized protein